MFLMAFNDMQIEWFESFMAENYRATDFTIRRHGSLSRVGAHKYSNFMQSQYRPLDNCLRSCKLQIDINRKKSDELRTCNKRAESLSSLLPLAIELSSIRL